MWKVISRVSFRRNSDAKVGSYPILLTSSHKVMGKRVNPPLLRYLGWATLVVMTVAAVAIIVTS
jgi:Mn2+/Fe2+ NRAMP family transporter